MWPGPRTASMLQSFTLTPEECKIFITVLLFFNKESIIKYGNTISVLPGRPWLLNLPARSSNATTATFSSLTKTAGRQRPERTWETGAGRLGNRYVDFIFLKLHSKFPIVGILMLQHDFES